MTKQQLRQTIGKRILDRRNRQNLTQAELAKRIRVCASQLSEIENGKRGVSIMILFNLEKEFGKMWGDWE